jgi:hypothetical protein
MLTNLLLLRIALISLLLSGLAFAGPQTPEEPLGRWVGGKWVGDGKMLDTDFSKAMPVSGVNNCAWSPDHVFVVCDQDISMNGKPDRALSIYAFDPEKKAYHMYGMSPAGERPRLTDLTISPDGNRWEYLGKAEISGKTVQFRTVNVFHDPDHVEWWSEYSNDGGTHWVKMGDGKESRKK